MKRFVVVLCLVSWSLLGQSPSSHAQAPGNEPESQEDIVISPDGIPFSEALPAQITNENYPDLIESFDYPNADIADVIRAISKLTGKRFIVEPAVRGNITIIAPTQITVAEAWEAFLSALATNGFTVVPMGKFLKIRNARDAQRDAIQTYAGEYFPNSEQMITRILKLRHISADEVNTRLRNLLTRFGDMQPYEPTNSLIISDFGSNIERLETVIREIDRPGFEERPEVIPIMHAKARAIAELIEQIINRDQASSPRAGAASRFRRATAPPETKSGSGESLSAVIPDDRTNTLIVVGNDAGIAKIRQLVKQLDSPLDLTEAGGVYVYYVRHSEAATLAETLSGVAKESQRARQEAGQAAEGGGGSVLAPSPGGGRAQPASASQAVFGGDVRIAADENTNSLLITAGKQDYDIVLNLLEKLDIAKDQVYVEAVILEMNMQNNNIADLTYFRFIDGAKTKGTARIGFNGSQRSLMDIINPASGQGAILGFGRGDTFDITTPQGTVTVSSLIGFLNLIKTYTNPNVLSTPQILALDNEESVIEVGEEVPVGSAQSVSTTGQLSAPVFKDATIRLAIKPFISRDTDTVRLNVEQAIRDVSTREILAADLAATTQAISKREIKTNIVLRSGDTAVLGGLVQDRDVISERKVPLLGDIPLLGWLFKGRTRTKEKVNLLVFLTPKVLRSPDAHGEILREHLGRRKKFLEDQGGGRDPHKDFFDRLEAQATAPPSALPEFQDDLEFEPTPFTTEDDFFLEFEN